MRFGLCIDDVGLLAKLRFGDVGILTEMQFLEFFILSVAVRFYDAIIGPIRA